MSLRIHNHSVLSPQALSVAAMLSAVVLSGCAGTRPVPTSEAPVPGTPSITAYSDRLDIEWKTNRPESVPISGYRVAYWVANTAAGQSGQVPPRDAQLLDEGLYSGDTDPRIDIESAKIESLKRGTRYGVAIATVDGNGIMSRYSKPAFAVTRPWGTFTLSPRFSGGTEGFSLSRGEVMGCMSELNDLYLFESREGPVLASPSRLDGLLRKTMFYDIGISADYDNVTKIDPEVAGQTRVVLAAEQVIIAVTDDGRQAKLRVRSIAGNGENLRVALDFAFQPRDDEPSF